MPAEGPNPGPARRGRRNPQIAQALELEATSPEPLVDEDDFLAGPGEIDDQDETLVLAGDVVAAKVVHTVDILGKESWITFGLQTRVMEDESEEQVFARVASVVNTRVLDLAEDAYRRIQTLQDEHDAALAARPRTRLQPRTR